MFCEMGNWGVSDSIVAVIHLQSFEVFAIVSNFFDSFFVDFVIVAYVDFEELCAFLSQDLQSGAVNTGAFEVYPL